MKGTRFRWKSRYNDVYTNVFCEEIRFCRNYIQFRNQLFTSGLRSFEEKLPIVAEKKPRKFIAIDETVVKANGKKYYVYAAIDVERNELMRVYPSRNYLTTKLLVVPKYCENKPKFIVDKAPWLIKALESLGLEY